MARVRRAEVAQQNARLGWLAMGVREVLCGKACVILPAMLNPAQIRAITLDLDDTLWPIAPTLERAEAVLQSWLDAEAPATAAIWRDSDRRRALRAEVNREHAALAHDLTHLRHEMIALACAARRRSGAGRAGVRGLLRRTPAVDCYADALPALGRLAARYPLLTLSNGNADVHLAGVGEHFTAQVSARMARRRQA